MVAAGLRARRATFVSQITFEGRGRRAVERGAARGTGLAHAARMKQPPLLVALALAGSACTSSQLQAVDVTVPCAPGDTTCQTAPIAPLAVGASTTLDVAVHPQPGGEAVATKLDVVDPTIAQLADGRLLAVGAGVTAVLIEADDGSVVDFTHLSTAQPQRISIHLGVAPNVDTRDLSGDVVVAPSSEVALTLFVQSDSQKLGGEFGEAWTIDNPEFVLAVSPGVVVVHTPAQGTGHLSVSALGFAQDINLEVTP